MADPNFGASVNVSRGGKYASVADREVSERSPFMGAEVAVWAVAGERYFPSPKTTPKIPAGFYRCCSSMQGPYFERAHFETDEILRLPDPTCDMLLKEFVTFWASSEKFAARGLSMKRGLILWGPPGSGKTTAVGLMAHHMAQEKQGIVVLATDPHTTIQCLHRLREIEPTRPLIVIYEDLDAMVERYGEAEWLALLDGEAQISNVVNVATTNYPERLDKRFVDRPGRFDRVTFVDMPHEEARAAYFAAKAPEVDEGTRARWVAETEGWSIAHLRELIVATQALGDGDAATIERLRDMQEMLCSDKPPPELHDGRQSVLRSVGRGQIGFDVRMERAQTLR